MLYAAHLEDQIHARTALHEHYNPLQPLATLPISVARQFAQEAHNLYRDLLAHRLEVILIPIERPRFNGHKKRVAISHNPLWYSQLYKERSNFRRDHSLQALQRLKNSRDGQWNGKRYGPYTYDAVYRALILHRLLNGYVEANDEYREDVPPNPRVIRYFTRAALRIRPIHPKSIESLLNANTHTRRNGRHH